MTSDSDKDLLATGGAFDIFSGVADRGTDTLLGRKLGDYRIEELIAEGGMGRVYRASRIDGSFDRDVAIKVSAVSGIDAGMRKRFLQEQSVLAGLNHPHISQLYDARVTEEGWPCIVMELIDGLPIDQYCKEQALDERRKVALLADVVSAVSYAHARLIVHRDLKPSNILVDNEGRAKLLDFGIAKLIEEGPAEATRQRPMTPRYASPEQLLGRPTQVASDIYQLGLLIYEVLAGEPLDQGTTLADAIKGAAAGDGVSVPPTQSGKIPADLRKIIECALRVDPDDRYSSATELRDDLENYLRGFPVQAAGLGATYRIGKFLRRNRAPVAAVTTALVALIGVSVWYTINLSSARDFAEQQATIAREERDTADRSLAEADAMVRLFQEVFRSFKADSRPLDEITAKEILLAGGESILEYLPEESSVRVPSANEFARAYLNLEMFEVADGLLDIAIEAASASDVDPVDADQSHRLRFNSAMSRRDFQRAAEINEHRWQRIAALDSIEKNWVPARQLDIASKQGSVLLELRRYEEAATWLETALTFNEVLESEPENHVNTLRNLARVKRRQYDYATANRYFQDALQLSEEKLGADHLFTAVVVDNIGWTYLFQNRPDEAAIHITRANESLERIYGGDSLARADSLQAVGRIEQLRGNYEEAISLLSQSVELIADAVGEDSTSLMWRLIFRGSSYYAIGLNDEARRDFERIIAILERAEVDDSQRHAGVYARLATIEREAGAHDAAADLLKRGYAVAERLGPEIAPDVAYLHAEAGIQAWTRGNEVEARQNWQRLDALVERFPDLQHAVVVDAVKTYLRFLEQQQMTDELAELMAMRPAYAAAVDLL